MKNLILILIITLPLTLLGQGWEQTYGGIDHDWGTSGKQTSDGGYIITGSTSSFGNGSNDVWLIKTDSQGDSIWTKTFGGTHQKGKSVQQTTDGGYIICGTREDIPEIGDVYLIKTDSQGDSIWTKTFGGVENDEGYSVQQTTDGGYIITGETESFGIGNGEQDVWLIKTDSQGDSVWTKTFGGNERDEGHSVQQTTDGGYIITGETNSFGNGESDVWLVKTDSQGDSLWTKTFGGNEQDGGSSVQQTIDGGYVIIGYTDDPFVNGGVEDLFVIKTDGNGNITSTFEIPLPNPDRKLEKTVNLIGQEIKPQTNTPIIEIFDDGSVEKKLIIEK